MTYLIDTIVRLSVWLVAEPVLLAGLAMMLLGPGVAFCWVGAQVQGVRVPRTATWPARFRSAPRGTERIEQRLSSLCTALSILTDSTEAGLREAITGLERLSGVAATSPEVRIVREQRVREAAGQGQSARDIAIAEGISEGEVRLRLRLQGLEQGPDHGFDEPGAASSMPAAALCNG
jgi:hypothetical protein